MEGVVGFRFLKFLSACVTQKGSRPAGSIHWRGKLGVSCHPEIFLASPPWTILGVVDLNDQLIFSLYSSWAFHGE